jgi:hypothetical protein
VRELAEAEQADTSFQLTLLHPMGAGFPHGVGGCSDVCIADAHVVSIAGPSARCRLTSSPSCAERLAPKRRRRFSCCTDYHLRREGSSLSSLGFPIAITWSRPIIRVSDTATGRTKTIRLYIRSLRRDHASSTLGLSRYTLYMQDYGGPVGFRMALAHPDRIEALIVAAFGSKRRAEGTLREHLETSLHPGSAAVLPNEMTEL